MSKTLSDQDIVIVTAKRTAIGNFSGSLSSLPGHILGKTVIGSIINDTNIAGEDISEVIIGQVLTADCGQNPARQAAIAAGIPKEVPAWTVNQVCGSGLKTVALAYQAIKSGEANIVIAGGQESMSNAPHAMQIRNGVRMGNGNFSDTMIKDGLWEAFNGYHMGVTAENIAKSFGISRKEQDEFACKSQNKTEEAKKNGCFDQEITPVIVPNRKGDIIFDKDEFPRDGVTVEALAKLRPAFDREGSVTAGNASGINDGAAMVMLMSVDEAEKRYLKPIAKIVSFGQNGVDPKLMGTGPISASKIALEKAGWSVGELDLIESNEAFAAQAIAVNREMGWDVDKVNVNGGSIALGHPIGASGTRVLVTLLNSMQQRDAKKGLVTLCVGGGMGVAMCLEAV